MRVSIVVRGTVQGVGFRPFVRRAAIDRGLVGWVQNGRDAVRMEVQGTPERVASFERALAAIPAPAAVTSLAREEVVDREEPEFEIRASACDAPGGALLPPDLATCAACQRDVWNARDRRHRYPFTNCTACGPRYSIVLELPYDRPRTTMAAFPMCDACRAEYVDLDDRRYHAQPVACPACGPTLSFADDRGVVIARREEALARASAVVDDGGIVALLGIGGFQLIADATNARAVDELRRRKQRPDKPFAVMFRDFASLAESAVASADERALLASPEAPIVLVPRRADARIVEAVAPRSPYVGAMLPYTPLHMLFVRGPVICTSGNRSNEPICTSPARAVERLGGIADAFLWHDRPIVRPLDDSLARATPRGPMVLRRARGYAPRSVGRIDERASVLAVGAHLKSTITLGHRGALVPSQHLGDLDAPSTRELLVATADEMCAFFRARPRVVACDLHPEYPSTAIAEGLAAKLGARLLRVQHHHAHVAACMAEHGLEGEVLGLAWDGTGFGTDGTIWGSEALVVRGASFRRFAHVRPFPLPGGDRAGREPRRAALGALSEAYPEALESIARPWFGRELEVQRLAIERRVNAPMCSSVGRLFDAVAAILGLCARATFEGQAAMELEHQALASTEDPYPLPLVETHAGLVADTRPLFEAMLSDRSAGVPRVARRFHESFAALGAAIAERAEIARVVLSGGCFQNRILAERLRARLERAGFEVYEPSAIPANDGGISVGQAWIAARA